MSQPSILTSRQKISGHKVSMSRHSALCHDSGVRRHVANKVGCTRDRGTLPATASDRGALSAMTKPSAHDRHVCATGMRA